MTLYAGITNMTYNLINLIFNTKHKNNMEFPKIAIHESVDSDTVIQFKAVNDFMPIVAELNKAGDIWGVYKDEEGELCLKTNSGSLLTNIECELFNDEKSVFNYIEENIPVGESFIAPFHKTKNGVILAVVYYNEEETSIPVYEDTLAYTLDGPVDIEELASCKDGDGLEFNFEFFAEGDEEIIEEYLSENGNSLADIFDDALVDYEDASFEGDKWFFMDTTQAKKAVHFAKTS